MIATTQMIPMLVEVCPSFQTSDELLYIALGDFAFHLLDLFRKNQTQTFSAVAQVIERLHVDGDPSARETATIGLLEGIQSVWGNNGVDPELFFPYLLPESSKCWIELNAFWDRVAGRDASEKS